MLKESSLTKLTLDTSYKEFLSEIKEKYQSAQLKAAHAVNNQLIQFYWQLGKDILVKQATAAWGSKFLEQLSHDLQVFFPGSKGFSERNLKFMRQFAEIYPNEIGKQSVSQLPWGHIIVLMQKVKAVEEREWYIKNSIEYGISRNVLRMQIEQNLYERQGQLENKVSNFKIRLPEPQSDLATNMLKNPYNFDFLTIGEKAHEKEIEAGLTQHISKFLIELGAGFAFMGNQFKINIEGDDYFLDMLFYHVKLRSYVVIELKATSFKPEYTGKLNFYLSAVDSILKSETDNPTIGLLLCKTSSKLKAEYSLRRVSSPIGISEYELMKKLPKKLAINLPTIEEIEAELSSER